MEFASPLSHCSETRLEDEVPAKVIQLGTRRKAAVLDLSI